MYLLLPLLFGLANGSRPWYGRQTQSPVFQNDPLCGRIQPWTTNRIVVGKTVTGTYPFMANIREIDGPHLCGGSLITTRWVLTAAHCVENHYDYEVMLGGNEIKGRGTVVLNTTETVRHPDYQHGRYADGDHNDLALLKLQRDIKVNEALPICLPKYDTTWQGTRRHTVTVLGWGQDKYGEYGRKQDKLKFVKIQTLPQTKCRNRLYGTNFDNKMICAGGGRKDACQGDSGGPMAFRNKNNDNRWTLKGTVAWGIGCGNYMPGVYMNVQKYLRWIAKVTQPQQRRKLHPYIAYLRKEQQRRTKKNRPYNNRYNGRPNQRRPSGISSRIAPSNRAVEDDNLAPDYYKYFLDEDKKSNNTNILHSFNLTSY